MKYAKPLIITSIIAAIIIGSVQLLSANGLNPVRMLNQARCESGGLLTASQNAGAVAADSDNGSGSGGPVSSLAKPKTTGATQGQNLIPNPELTTTNGTPDGWQTNVFNHNNAKFSLTPGQNSRPALRVDITEYTDGDADWYYQSVNVTPDSYYAFHDAYLSSANTRPVLMLRHTSGNVDYLNLKQAPASNTWTNYDITFFVPSDVNQALVFHPLAYQGTLETQDYALTPATATGFSEPLVSITFDDGWKSIHDNALPLLKHYNIQSTQYLISGYLGRTKLYMSAADVYDMMAAGNEVGSHTVDHLDLAKASDATVKYEMTQSQSELAKCFEKPTDYAAPYGTYNQTTTQVAQKTYQTARSTDVGFNTRDNLNPYSLLVQNVAADTTTAQINDWLATAKAHNAWLILVYHQVETGNSHYARRTSDFEHDLQAIKASGLPVKTIRSAYAEVKNQTKN